MCNVQYLISAMLVYKQKCCRGKVWLTQSFREYTRIVPSLGKESNYNMWFVPFWSNQSQFSYLRIYNEFKFEYCILEANLQFI